MNNNNWGSQPNRPPYNGLPQMPPMQQQQQGFQQPQYGNGNAMAYMGNQHINSNSNSM
ncbi:hypothetical protein N0V93_006173 [Gnomoniopsis smithogilvyi]|uniref:Uncharacterized protein n=1 Tax=Gnomoniopsis smithogilvyi TaxID=1191159 RepID=A0A9W9CUH3_9PEZI|nr:hypothetical protein N0V93_006173 [Gnomoniopsis smithogilvyi]